VGEEAGNGVWEHIAVSATRRFIKTAQQRGNYKKKKQLLSAPWQPAVLDPSTRFLDKVKYCKVSRDYFKRLSACVNDVQINIFLSRPQGMDKNYLQ
jgi:hypothetical protein